MNAIQYFFALIRSLRADEQRAHVLARRAWRRGSPATRASATTTFAPASVARRAASTLLAMPPLPTPPVDLRTCGSASAPTSRTTGMRVPDPSSSPSTSLSKHDELRVDERRHHRRELVVVAELDLVDRDRVVLVEDGDRPRLEKRAQGGACVVGARPVGEVRVREEHLRDGETPRVERLLVRPHEQRLARRRRGLQPRHLLRARAVTELLHPERDGAARHDDERRVLARARSTTPVARRCRGRPPACGSRS